MKYQVELQGRVTSYRSFTYEIDAESRDAAIESVRSGEGKVIEERHVETIDQDSGSAMTLMGVWDENGEDV